LLRKYVDSKAGSEMMGQSDLAFCRFRYAEVLLNAAEAAWELGEKAKAADYLNEVRRRAGIREIEPDEITGYETFLRERTAEFAFEGLRFYDLKRFRIADKLFDGQADTETALIYGLWPYKVYAPGDPDDGKWIFRRIHNTKRKFPLWFQTKNYYASIDQSVLNNNPLLVKNPYQE
ncbi:RagB/SusD family nutrient uptake outer membrane protein, partial [Alistipes sp. CAG:268]